MKLKILALDQASNCGWCCGDDLYGVWNLTTQKDESIGMKLIRFEAKLEEIIKLKKITLICYERVAGRFKSALIHSAKLVAIVERYCEASGIEYRAFSAKEIKSFATGKGNCNKQAMIKAAQEKFNYKGENDNEADAIHIYQLAKKLYGV